SVQGNIAYAVRVTPRASRLSRERRARECSAPTDLDLQGSTWIPLCVVREPGGGVRDSKRGRDRYPHRTGTGRDSGQAQPVPERWTRHGYVGHEIVHHGYAAQDRAARRVVVPGRAVAARDVAPPRIATTGDCDEGKRVV